MTEENAPVLAAKNQFPKAVNTLDSDLAQIHRAMFAAKCDMPEIDKTGEMKLGGKSVPFTKIDDIRAHLYPILERHGIMTYPLFVTQESTVTAAAEPMSQLQAYPTGHDLAGTLILDGREIRDGRIPTRSIRVQVVYDIQFLFVGDNSSVTVRVIGEAMDTSSDKATGKATTAAIKRAFVETFGIVDRTEMDIEGENPEDKNRAATTDRRDGSGDRGSQMRNAATGTGAGASGTRRSGPQRSGPAAQPAPAATQEPTAEPVNEQTGEVPEPPVAAPLPSPAAPPEETELDKQKRRVRTANSVLQMSPVEINALATELTGKETRAEWSVLQTALKKIADELENRVAARSAE